MSPIRLALMSLPVLLGTTLAGCGYHTERTVYTPAPAPTTVAVVPSSGYYYYPARGYYYRDSYHPAYYSY